MGLIFISDRPIAAPTRIFAALAEKIPSSEGWKLSALNNRSRCFVGRGDVSRSMLLRTARTVGLGAFRRFSGGESSLLDGSSFTSTSRSSAFLPILHDTKITNP